jgi:hypothetical protein
MKFIKKITPSDMGFEITDYDGKKQFYPGHYTIQSATIIRYYLSWMVITGKGK